MTVRVLVIMTVLAAGVLAGGLRSQADAVPIGVTAFSPTATVIDFDSLTTNTVVRTQYSGLGVVLSSPGGGPGGVVAFLAPGQVLSVASSIILTFSANVHRVGVDYSSESTLHLDLYNASNELIATVANANLTGFLGLEVNEQVAYAIVHDSGFGFTIDNVRYENPTAVPEPRSLLLAGIGIVAAGIVWRMGRDPGRPV